MTAPAFVAGAPGALWPAAGVAAGFVFTGTLTPLAAATGEPVTGFDELPAETARALRTGSGYVDIRTGRFVAQAWQAFRNLEATLAASGSSLDRLAFLRVVLRRAEDVPVFLRIAERAAGAPLPAGDLVVACNSGSDPELDIFLDAIATTAAAARPEHVTLAGLAALSRPFASFTRTAPFLFTSALLGLDPESGESLGRASRLDEEDRALVTALQPANSEIEAFFVDQAAMWRNLRRVLDAAGAALGDVLYHGAWLTRPMQYLAYGSVPRLLTPRFGGFCLSCFPVTALAAPNTQWSGRLVTLLPGSGVAKATRTEPHGLSRAYHGLVAAGPLILSSGEVPIDVAAQLLVDRPSRLAAAERGLNAGQPQRRRAAASEAACIYRLIAEGLAAHDARMSDVVHQTLYLADLDDLPSVMLVAHRAFAGRVPATSVVPVLGATAFDETRAEIEVIAAPAAR